MVETRRRPIELGVAPSAVRSERVVVDVVGEMAGLAERAQASERAVRLVAAFAPKTVVGPLKTEGSGVVDGRVCVLERARLVAALAVGPVGTLVLVVVAVFALVAGSGKAVIDGWQRHVSRPPDHRWLAARKANHMTTLTVGVEVHARPHERRHLLVAELRGALGRRVTRGAIFAEGAFVRIIVAVTVDASRLAGLVVATGMAVATHDLGVFAFERKARDLQVLEAFLGVHEVLGGGVTAFALRPEGTFMGIFVTVLASQLAGAEGI